MDLQSIETALHAWAERALGCAAVWDGENGPRQAHPYVTLNLTGPFRLGFGPETSEAIDPALPPGAEIVQTVREHQEWSLSVQAHAGAGGSAPAILAAAAMRMRLPGAREELRAAGVVLVEVGDTQDLSQLFATAIESRAAMDVRLRLVDQATEATTYIGTVEGASPWGTWKAPQ